MNKGFTLIEFIIYIILTISLMYWLIPWSISIFCFNNKMHYNVNQVIDCCIVHDLFIKDIFDSSHTLHSWINTSSNVLLWKAIDGTHKSWYFKNKNIYRTIGIYNAINSAWIKNHTDLLLTNVSTASFSMDKDASSITTIRFDIVLNDVHYFFTSGTRYAYQ